MSDPARILEFHGVALVDEPASSIAFSLAAGEMMAALTERDAAIIPLADVAEGLVAPTRGTVLFLGEDWRSMAPARAERRRGKIGRVFEGGSRPQDYYIDEDMTLAQRHHTRRSLKDIEAEADRLCRSFGLAGLPRDLRGNLSPGDAQGAAFARAFLGKPVLIVLENPTRGFGPELLERLVKAILEARERGAAVWWITDETDVWNQLARDATRRFRVSGSAELAMPKETETG